MIGGRALFAATALLTVAADLASKVAVEKAIERYERVVVVDGFFHLTNVRNPGAAFGLFAQGGWGRTAFFIAVTLAAMLFMLAMARRAARSRARGAGWELMALGLLFGGAAGNLVDRLRYGEVVDFLLFFWKSYHYPAFNVADIAITLGVGLLIYTELFGRRKR